MIGNDAVHPGEINTDDPATVLSMFDLINLVVTERITQPRRVTEVFSALPENKRKAIEERNRPK